ncbi:unnamed protein product [Citrullus colocynthis]|uniref:Uncharacterized protein n=1 Tax=Citrullus colocynthis TaxID=252529 RepID=A0ABP0YBN0_9ROSI
MNLINIISFFFFFFFFSLRSELHTSFHSIQSSSSSSSSSKPLLLFPFPCFSASFLLLPLLHLPSFFFNQSLFQLPLFLILFTDLHHFTSNFLLPTSPTSPIASNGRGFSLLLLTCNSRPLRSSPSRLL